MSQSPHRMPRSRTSISPATPGEPVPTPSPYPNSPQFVTTVPPGPMGMPLHACMGLNSCKASDRFGLNGPPAPFAPNACAGQGYCATATPHTCHVQNDCRAQGGCGLYGTAEEMNLPGANECRSLGSCATPINAERFSTNGKNQGKSVWLRAREVFQTTVWPVLRQELLAKRAMGLIPADSLCRHTSVRFRRRSRIPVRRICGFPTATRSEAT